MRKNVTDDKPKLPEAIQIGQAILARTEVLDEHRKDPERFAPVEIPHLKDLSAIMGGGLPKSEPFIITIISKEKIGKTTLAVELADAWQEFAKVPVLYFCLEELDYQIAERVLAKRLQISRKKLYRKQLDDVDIEQMKQWGEYFVEQNSPFYLQDKIFKLPNMVRQALEMKIPLLVIDNLQLADRKGMPGRDSREKLEAISAYCRQARNKHDLSFLIVAQEGQEGMSFGSGQVNRDTDGILLLKHAIETHHEEVKGKRQLVEGPVANLRVIEAKEGRLPWQGSCTVQFNGDYSQLKDIETKTIVFEDSGVTSKEEQGPLW